MSAWINVEYYVLSSMPSLALNSIISQSSRQASGQAALGADRRRLLGIRSTDDSSLLKLPYEIIFGSGKESERSTEEKESSFKQSMFWVLSPKKSSENLWNFSEFPACPADILVAVVPVASMQMMVFWNYIRMCIILVSFPFGYQWWRCLHSCTSRLTGNQNHRNAASKRTCWWIF